MKNLKIFQSKKLFRLHKAFFVIVISKATKQSLLTSHLVIATLPFLWREEEVISSLLQFVIANRRVGKCVCAKQFPHCTFLLVLSVLGRLLRLIVIRLAMTKREGRARNDVMGLFACNNVNEKLFHNKIKIQKQTHTKYYSNFSKNKKNNRLKTKL